MKAEGRLSGVRDLVQDSTNKGIEQFRENLKATVPDSERGQQFVNAFLDSYQKRFHSDETAGQFVGIYDKHFSEEEIKGLLQFYGSPLGQKYAVEMPKINEEIQAANRSAGTRIAKEVLQEMRQQYPGVGAQARLAKQRRGQIEQAQAQVPAQP